MMKRRDLLVWTATGAAFAAIGLRAARVEAHDGTITATHVHPSLGGGETACGGSWNNGGMVAAAKRFRCGTRLRLRNPRNGAVITVRVTDHSPNSALDLSRTAFSHLADVSQGRVQLEYTVL